MKKNLIIGILISAVFLYLSLRGMDIGSITRGFRSVKAGYILPVVFMLILIQALRSYRWGLILSPIEKIDQASLFSVTSVGFLALLVMPARIGELARPYLIAGKSNIKMTSALGTIFIERIFDCLTVLAFFFVILFFVPLPAWLINSGLVFLSITLLILFWMLLLIFKREASLALFDRVSGILPEKWRRVMGELIHHFIDGIEMITDPRLIFHVSFLSFLIWIIDAAAIYVLFLAFGLKLSIVAAMIVMVVVVIGITLPTAPGFIGNFHFFCILGLALFGISKSDALTYAIMLHFLSIGVITILGLAFLPFNKFHFSDLQNRQN
ncbi:MAG: lysylphosphatidylglycerol synthase transmembrane domain-containing protein [Syntrophales bacterium]